MSCDMKKIFKFFAISFAILAGACTNKAVESPASFTRELTFTASREGVSPDTKTVRMEDGSTWWYASEEISVFHGGGSNGGSQLTSQNTTLQEIVEFSGSVQMSGSGKEFWAVYPYSQDNECDGTSITTVIPTTQTAAESNFSGDAFPAIAKSKTLDLAFWNICGGIKFSVTRNDIKSVAIKGNNGEALAGKVRVAFNADGHPEMTEVIESQTEVTLVAPDGGYFKPGKYYYITLRPISLDGGITLTFYTSSEKGEIVSDKSQTIKRSIFGVLKNVDSKVMEWKSAEPEAVDLGLSVKWATFNVGATKPEEYGDYFAWGETESKEDYSWETYKFRTSGDSYDNVKFSKYNTDSSRGVVDNNTVLDLEDDVAHVKWGGNWRMPTLAEQQELLDNCTWEWTNNYNGTGVSGRKVTSNKAGYTDKSIFLPAAGFTDGKDFSDTRTGGYYWSSSLGTGHSYNANHIHFYIGDCFYSASRRSCGRSVRPVCP